MTVVCGTVFSPSTGVCDERPNVITLFIDDMGWSDLSCFGGKAATTQNIDSLAAEGIRFTNFYVNSPICSPSRVALSTGQYPQRWRISSYLAHRKSNRNRGMDQWLDPSAPVLARALKQSGYATGHFGKWHMGGQRDVGDAPLITQYGFDASLTNFEGLGPRVLPLKDAYDGKPPGKHDLGSANLGRGPIRWEDRSIVTAAFVDEALKFIDQAQADKKPFFVNVWPDDVHSPFFPPEVLRDRTDGSKRALYYAVLDAMDEQLGKLIDRVREDPELRQNTIILVMSDNGHEEGAGSSDPLRGAKTWLYEGGVRSPLIVWGPGWVTDQERGTTNDDSILCAMDVNRSLYSLTNTELPDDVQFDGEDLASTLLGKSREGRNEPIFWRRPPDRPGTKEQDNPDLAVRSGRWKYYANYDGSARQLYDLSVDVSETQNISDANTDVADRLHSRLVAWNATLPPDAGDPSWQAQQARGSVSQEQFVNPIGEGADPWVVRDPDNQRYLWCMSDGNRAIAIHTSDSLTSLGKKHIVWSTPETGPFSREVWAPELHFLDDRWYVYFAASDGKNENHLTYVLKSKTRDPLGEYELHGPMATGDGPDGLSPNIWAIDMTVLELAGQRFAIWSGWDAPGTDQQYLYIAPMKSPTELAGPRIRLCDNDDHLWERTEPDTANRGLNEGPQIFQAKGRTCVVYSCGASWLPTYKLGMMELVGDDPLEPSSWMKRPKPVFSGTDQVYGVGHSCFVRSPDGRQWWHVFHAKQDREPGWRRAIYVQPMKVGKRGFPLFGEPIPGGESIDRPAGEFSSVLKLPVSLFGKSPSGATWSYYGHHQFADLNQDGLHLGRVVSDPINAYRSGEKILLDHRCPDNVSTSVQINFRGDESARDAGILFRCSGASVGYDAQRGYFAGLIPKTKLAILGKTNGTTWTELARAPTQIDVNVPQTIAVTVVDADISVSHNGMERIQFTDDSYTSGTAGLRVVNTHAVFSEFTIERADR
ncbi:MAG: sulfatase-like hydrolase/transferase [Pirellulaceae bacterium]|nr:sulfatase-like hydrolase/transferase [Pirellulaceae bacterium]